jgi:histone demethylase JARID1
MATNDSKRIPEAPVFRPTAAEWKDTLGYIKYAQSKAEYAGICRIIPPKGWKPPFAVDRRNFRFKTRVQNLSLIDGVARIEKEFTVKLRKFLFQQGSPVGVTPIPRFHSSRTGLSEPVNLYRMLKAVSARGGFDRVCRDDVWKDVGTDLELRVTARSSSELRVTYERYLLLFERHHAVRTHVPTTSEGGRKRSQRGDDADEGNSETTSSSSDESEVSIAASAAVERGSEAVKAAHEAGEAAAQVCELARVLADHIAKRRKAWFKDEYGSENDDSEVDVSMSIEQQQQQQSWDGVNKTASDIKRETQDGITVTKQEKALEQRARVGARFYKFFDSIDSCLRGTVVGASHHSNPVYTVHFPLSTEWGNGGKNTSADKDEVKVQTMDRDTLMMHLASGGSRKEAKDAHEKGICQTCMRANDLDVMLECDGCDFTYHTHCLKPKLDAPPEGDWFCEMCIGEHSETNKKSKTFLSVTAVPELATFGFGDGEQEMSLDDFKYEADAFKATLLADRDACEEDLKDPLLLQTEFWSLISNAAQDAATVCGEAADIKVTYGSDIDTGVHGSGFPTPESMARVKKALDSATAASARNPRNNELREARQQAERRAKQHDKYMNDGWNLNNLPRLNGSLLQYVEGDITGILKPWLYIGMCFSSFCWHTEDHYFASINYVHWGEPKTWYGVSGTHADAFEDAARALAPELFEVRPDILTGIVTMFNPFDMLSRGVPVYRTTQSAGEFVVTFPRAYHGGFNNGFNCAEAVNFATPEWLPFGTSCLARYKELKKMPVVAHDSFICKLAELCVAAVERFVCVCVWVVFVWLGLGLILILFSSV